LQRKRADCGTASPVIAALCGQNANRQSEHERGGGDDYAFGHHGSPLSFYVHVACIAAYSTAACDGGHKLGEYTVEHAEHVSIVIAKNYGSRASLARLVPWDSLGASRRLDVPYLVTKAPGAAPGLSFTLCVSAGTELGGKCGVGQLAMTRRLLVRCGKPRPVRDLAKRVGALIPLTHDQPPTMQD